MKRCSETGTRFLSATGSVGVGASGISAGTVGAGLCKGAAGLGVSGGVDGTKGTPALLLWMVASSFCFNSSFFSAAARFASSCCFSIPAASS